METKVLETTAVKGKKGNFVITTVTETKEVMNEKTLKSTLADFEKAMVQYDNLIESFQSAIDLLSTKEDLSLSMKPIIGTFDGVRTQYTDRKNQLARMKEVLAIIKTAK